MRPYDRGKIIDHREKIEEGKGRLRRVNTSGTGGDEFHTSQMISRFRRLTLRINKGLWEAKISSSTF